MCSYNWSWFSLACWGFSVSWQRPRDPSSNPRQKRSPPSERWICRQSSGKLHAGRRNRSNESLAPPQPGVGLQKELEMPEMHITSLQIGWITGLTILGLGLFGLLTSRNLIKIIVALQLLVKSALLALVLAGNGRAQIDLAQSLCITVIVADTIVAVVSLAFAIQVRRRIGTLDIRDLSTLRG
ncbi:MAG TPA: NADH-quinone oxidoreductase subunit K [Chloroflexi bacterium]|nr:NADH-quinone oxidoreductase subunit K [Chloroflexota bacterium]